MKKALSLLVFVAFSVLTLEVVWTAGFQGMRIFAEPWGVQVAFDLIIAASFAGVWMWRDARERGLSALPFLILLPLTGSIALLAYWVRRSFAERENALRSHGGLARAQG